MDYLDQFGIPVYGIQYGEHKYEFDIDETFFKCFEDSPIQGGKYKAIVVCDKRENEFLLSTRIEGYFESPCDRCLAEIEVSSSIEKMVWIKYSDQKHPVGTDEDYIYIDESEHIYNVADFIFEMIVLSIPMVRAYDCENDPNPKCDFKVLSYLQQDDNDDYKGDSNNIADEFKKLRNL
jgi:uncharacterized protein